MSYLFSQSLIFYRVFYSWYYRVIFLIGDIPAGCAAALKCTAIEYCTAEGVISTSPVVLTREQESYRVPLTVISYVV